MEKITRTIKISKVEIYDKKDFTTPIYTGVMATDDETKSENGVIKKYLETLNLNDEERKIFKKKLVSRVVTKRTYKAEIDIDAFIQLCIDNGIFEEIEE